MTIEGQYSNWDWDEYHRSWYTHDTSGNIYYIPYNYDTMGVKTFYEAEQIVLGIKQPPKELK